MVQQPYRVYLRFLETKDWGNLLVGFYRSFKRLIENSFSVIACPVLLTFSFKIVGCDITVNLPNVFTDF